MAINMKMVCRFFGWDLYVGWNYFDEIKRPLRQPYLLTRCVVTLQFNRNGNLIKKNDLQSNENIDLQFRYPIIYEHASVDLNFNQIELSCFIYFTYILHSFKITRMYMPNFVALSISVCASVRLFVRHDPSVPLEVKSFDQGSFRWSWSSCSIKMGCTNALPSASATKRGVLDLFPVVTSF